MVDTLTAEWKPINKLRVLGLSPRVSSWNYDAKNCCRIYARMLKARALSPRVYARLRQWALYLIEYAGWYNIKLGQGYVLTRAAQWAPNSLWLLNLLHEIASHKTVSECYGQEVTSFNVETWEKLPGKGRCSIMHTPLDSKNLTKYRTVLKDGTVYISTPVGSSTFQKLRVLINRGLAKHRAPSARWKLKHQIEENHERNARYRARRERLFS